MYREIPNIEVMDEAMVEILRRKTGFERLQIAWRMWSDARVMLTHHLRNEHPEWNANEVQREVARRMSHGAI